MTTKRGGPTGSVPPTGFSPCSTDQIAEGLEALLRLAQAQSRIADGLVLLEPLSWEELTRAESVLVSGLAAHLSAPDSWLSSSSPAIARGQRRLARTLRAEHQAFPRSVTELDHLLKVVHATDHGGNRQALGQYWRILLEAADRHAREELDLLRAPRHTREPE